MRATFADYDPQNYNAGRHLGPVSVRTALGSSLNVPAVVALGRFVGARQAFYEFGRWGFRFPAGLDEYGAGFILGNAEIRLLDLANAYAGLARGGLAGQARLLARDGTDWERVASVGSECDHHGHPLRPAGAAGDVRRGFAAGFPGRRARGGENWHQFQFPGQMVRRLRWPTHRGRLGRVTSTVGPWARAVGIHAAAPLWHALMDALLRERHDPAVPDPDLEQDFASA